MHFIFHKVGDKYVVWLEQANRFMQMYQPAFIILQDWANQIPNKQIVANCASKFKLKKKDAKYFVDEVTNVLESISNQLPDEPCISIVEEINLPINKNWFETKYYQINGKIFCFKYGHQYIKELIHPGFEYLEIMDSRGKIDHCFSLSLKEDHIFLHSEGLNSWSCKDSKTDQFVGLFYVQMLNAIYKTIDSDWIGAVHASTVAYGKNAILLTAPSGNGKSTFAAMLMNKGYKVLSDDFSPISKTQGKVYPFPEGISVKNRSLNILQTYFPALYEKGNSNTAMVRERFIPLGNGNLPVPVSIKAIVFLQYDPSVEFVIKKVSNLDLMDAFLQQMWLVPTETAARAWMDWYLNLDCYLLHYSSTLRAVGSITQLLER